MSVQEYSVWTLTVLALMRTTAYQWPRTFTRSITGRKSQTKRSKILAAGGGSDQRREPACGGSASRSSVGGRPDCRRASLALRYLTNITPIADGSAPFYWAWSLRSARRGGVSVAWRMIEA